MEMVRPASLPFLASKPLPSLLYVPLPLVRVLAVLFCYPSIAVFYSSVAVMSVPKVRRTLSVQVCLHIPVRLVLRDFRTFFTCLSFRYGRPVLMAHFSTIPFLRKTENGVALLLGFPR